MMIEDARKTQERLRRAAEAGDADAMFDLAVLLKDRDPVQAGEWWQRPAKAQRHCNKRASAINLCCSSTGPTLVIGERCRERLSFAACGTCQWIDATAGKLLYAAVAERLPQDPCFLTRRSR
jgi:TPR repeat protein